MSDKYRYWRMQAQGNAFLILDARDRKPLPDREQVRSLAQKAKDEGKPFDQLLVLKYSSKADVFMRIFNRDGSESEACGNGALCVGRLITAEISDWIETREQKGVMLATSSNPDDDPIIISRHSHETDHTSYDFYGAKLKSPRFAWREIPLKHEVPNTYEVHLDPPIIAEGKPLPPFFGVNIGNPHAVFFFDTLEVMPDLRKVGEELEDHSIFPRGANISFAHIEGGEIQSWQVWERGTHMTESCGTAACAIAVAGIKTEQIYNSRKGVRFPSKGYGPCFVHYNTTYNVLRLDGQPDYQYETTSAQDEHYLTMPNGADVPAAGRTVTLGDNAIPAREAVQKVIDETKNLQLNDPKVSENVAKLEEGVVSLQPEKEVRAGFIEAYLLTPLRALGKIGAIAVIARLINEAIDLIKQLLG